MCVLGQLVPQELPMLHTVPPAVSIIVSSHNASMFHTCYFTRVTTDELQYWITKVSMHAVIVGT
jgi:hypothetical protein